MIWLKMQVQVQVRPCTYMTLLITNSDKKEINIIIFTFTGIIRGYIFLTSLKDPRI